EELAARMARCRVELKLLRELDAIDTFRWSWGSRGFPERAALASRLQAALADYELIPEEGRTEEAAGRGNRSLIRDRVLGALDLWVACDRSVGVRALLRSADPDVYRNAGRDALLAKDGTVAALADQQEALEQPPRFAMILGWIDPISEERGRAVMESALRTRHADLSLLMQLGISYPIDRRTGADERVRWFQAALAAHPGNLAALNNLGNALRAQGNTDGAIPYYQEAIRLDSKFANA